MKLYLITGFLGAGKTTFLQNFIQLFAGKRVHLIINEFGKAGVDGKILQQLQATMEQINHGSIFCSYRLDQFEQVLENALHQPPEVVLVEASGLSDPTNVEKILSADKFSGISYQGSVCIVDPICFPKVVSTARMCKKQVAVSSFVLINKCDMASPCQIEETYEMLQEMNPQAVIQQTSFGKFEPVWLQSIFPRQAMAEKYQPADLTLQRAQLTLREGISQAALKGILSLLADDTYRMKGFICADGKSYLVNCVCSDIRLEVQENAAPDNRLVLLAGKGMRLRACLKQVKEWYPQWVEEIVYD